MTAATRRFTGWIAATDPLDLATRITLISILYSDMIAGDFWLTKGAMKTLAAAALILPPLHRRPAIWGALTAAMLVRTLMNWAVQDNHLYLITYWCGAVFLATLSPRPADVLAVSGRWMIGLAFALAVLWKAALSPTYMDGAFFHFTLLRDDRFHDWATLTAAVTESMHQRNLDLARSVGAAVGGVESAVLTDTPATPLVADLMTWWTIAIEALIAAAFLWPGVGRGISRLRNPALLVFAWSTYLVVAVTTFGWTLCAMGLAQTPRDHRLTRLAYIATVPAVLIFEQVPIVAAINHLLGR